MHFGIFINRTIDMAGCRNAFWLGNKVLTQCHPEQDTKEELCQRVFAGNKDGV